MARAPACTPARKATPEDLHRIADWLFAVLRFAVTRKHTDRASVVARTYKCRHFGASQTLLFSANYERRSSVINAIFIRFL
jgi:hypothetical protein